MPSTMSTGMRQALNQAHKWGMVARNVAMLVDAPTVERVEVKPLSPLGASRLLEAAKGDRIEALYRVALSLGLRQGEALGLRWEDLDLDARQLRVRKQLQAINGTLTLVEPKAASARRTIPLPVALVSALRSHRTRQIAERLKAGEAWHDGGLVFCTKVGTPIHPRNLIRSFHSLLKRAEMEPMRFHDTASCISIMAAQGIPQRTAMTIAGHLDIRLTQNVYTHVYDEAKQQVADAMDRLFPGEREAVG